MATFQDVAEEYGITHDQVRQLKRVMETTWDMIGWDWMSCFDGGEAEAYDVYGSEASMVAEATIDAGRIKTHNPGEELDWVSKMPDGSWRKGTICMAEAVWEARV